MTLRLFNSLGKKMEVFKPVNEKVVTVFGAIGIWIGIELAAVGLVVGLLV